MPADFARKAYEGPTLPKEEVAVIMDSALFFGPFQLGVRITGIDGKPRGSPAEVLPGRHSIDLVRRVTAGCSTGPLATTLFFNAEAGHLYVARTGSTGGIFQRGGYFPVWIEDDATGEVVAGLKPGTP